MSYAICLDTETTGLDPKNDDILQLSIVGTDGFEFDKFYNSPNHKSWSDAERIHGISPEDVEEEPYFIDDDNLDEVQDIIDSATVLIGYNINYDLNFLREAGLDFSGLIINDVMFDYADFMGKQDHEKYWNEKYQHYRSHKLVQAADYFGYNFRAHNSLEDVKATLYVWDCLQDEDFELTEYDEDSLEDRARR